MDKEIFLKNVTEQYLNLDKILTFDSNFREFGSYDSLTGMTIMVMIKDKYGVDITESQFRSKKTIAELYDFIKQRKEL
jgi:acyl carrier protein